MGACEIYMSLITSLYCSVSFHTNYHNMVAQVVEIKESTTPYLDPSIPYHYIYLYHYPVAILQYHKYIKRFSFFKEWICSFQFDYNFLNFFQWPTRRPPVTKIRVKCEADMCITGQWQNWNSKMYWCIIPLFFVQIKMTRRLQQPSTWRQVVHVTPSPTHQHFQQRKKKL